MTKVLKIALYLTLTGFLMSHIPVAPASAVSAGLGVGSAIKDIEIPAGLTQKDSITLFNNSTSTPLPVHLDLVLWNLKVDADEIEFVRAEEALNATRWFDLEVTDFILEPGEAREIKYTISPPLNVSPGSYFVMMRFQPTFPEFYFEEKGPRFIPEVGTLFFLKIPLLSLDGGTGYGADIVSLEPGGADRISLIDNFVLRANAGVFDGAVKTLLARIRNTGIFHFKASGQVEIRNIFGFTVAKAELPSKYLLPDRTRPLETIILPRPDTESLSFIGRTFKKLVYGIRTNTYFGRYSAVVTLSVPREAQIVESVNFWVIPWQFWLVLSLISIGSAIIIKRGQGRLALALKVLIRRRVKNEES